MLAKDPLAEAAWSMLEELFLMEANTKARTHYCNRSDDEKRAALKAFAKDQSLKSKRWIEISGAMQPL
jgi:hypothetical protein